MAQACTACGGVGYGSIDPEFGYRKGGPCPVCTETFETIVTSIKTGRKNSPKLTFGPANVGVQGVPTKSIAVVDGDRHASDSEAYDPGVTDYGTDAGSKPISIDEALAQAGAEA